MNLLINYKKFSQLKKNVLSGTILAVIQAILIFAAYPIFIRYLGVERYGLWAVISVVLTFSQLGDLGINDAVVKYIAEEYGKKNFKEINSYIVNANLLMIIPSLLIIIVLVVFNQNILDLLKLTSKIKAEVGNLIPMFGFLTVLMFYSNIIWGALKGVGRVDFANYIYMVCNVLQIMVSVILVISGFGVWGLFLGNVVLYFFLFIFCFFMLKKVFILERFRKSHFDIQKIKKLVKFGGAILGSRSIVMLLDPFNRIIIARYISLPAVTYYDISLKVVMYLRSLFHTGLIAIMPKVSELNSGNINQKSEISRIHIKGIKFVVFFALPLFILVFIFGKPILNLWLGNNYNINILVSMRVFLAGYFVNLLSVPAYYIFMGLNKVRICFYTIIIQSLINMVSVLMVLIFLKNINLTEIALICSSGIAAAAVFVLIKFLVYEKNFRNNSHVLFI